MTAVRVCAISDAECSRGCGVGACKQEIVAADAAAPKIVAHPGERVSMTYEQYVALRDGSAAQPDERAAFTEFRAALSRLDGSSVSLADRVMILSNATFLMDEYVRAAAPQAATRDDSHSFKNFHRLLCERFDYVHDEKDWRRDQISLIEHIARQVKAAPQAVALTDEQIEDLQEAREIIENMVSNVEADGNYSKEATCTFLRQALQCIPTITPPTERMSDAVRDVLAERARQVNVEGWAPEHDDKYRDHEMSCAAGCYAMHTLAYPAGDPPPAWPWAADWWKPTTHRRNLIKASALILAEIERIDRAARKAEIARSGSAGGEA